MDLIEKFITESLYITESSLEEQWKYVKPIKSPALISKFEQQFKCKLPGDYKSCVKKYNGGRPPKRVFDTSKTKEREMKTLLSFNPDDSENIWSANDSMDEEFQSNYIAFANDSAGNLICFKKSNKLVVLWDHETNNVEAIAPNFSGFIKSLYDA